jgi:hypothetical protein
MEIIRNCSHRNSLQVAFELDDQNAPVKVVKTAFDEEGVKLLSSEFNGVRWYSETRNLADRSVLSFVHHREKSARLELAYMPGQVADLRAPLKRNYRKIHNALAHYFSHFRKRGCFCSHGDYSIDNILFDGDLVVWVLDWENFNNKLPLEFDMVYCVMEASYFAYQRHGMLQASESDAAIELLRYGIEKLSLPYAPILKAPASYIRRLFLDHASVFGPQIAKYPLVICPEEDIRKIDAAINKRTGL